MDRKSSEYRWLLVALLVPCAMAQTPEQDRRREYDRQQDEIRQEQQRRAQEAYQAQLKATEEAQKRQREGDDDRRMKDDADASKRRAQAAPAAQNSADMTAMRAKLLGMPPLPDERNPLLGRWRVDAGPKPQRKDELGLLMGMLANPGGAACQFTFGGGITEFKAKSWASIDGHGDDSLGPIVYRGDARRVWALPAKGVELMGFDLADPNRAVSLNLGGCTLVRAAAAATTAALPQPGTATPTRPAAPAAAGAVVDGAAFRCGDGSLLHVSLCQGASPDAVCKLSELHLPGLQMGKLVRRVEIAARVKACEAGGIRYGADDKPVFTR